MSEQDHQDDGRNQSEDRLLGRIYLKTSENAPFEDQKRTENKEAAKKWLDPSWVTAAFTVVIAVATSAYVGVAYYQWHIMRDQLRLAEEQMRIAEAQNRPRIIAEVLPNTQTILNPGVPIDVHVRFENIGQRPAYNTLLQAKWFHLPRRRPPKQRPDSGWVSSGEATALDFFPILRPTAPPFTLPLEKTFRIPPLGSNITDQTCKTETRQADRWIGIQITLSGGDIVESESSICILYQCGHLFPETRGFVVHWDWPACEKFLHIDEDARAGHEQQKG